jgi:hypothetical protein
MLLNYFQKCFEVFQQKVPWISRVFWQIFSKKKKKKHTKTLLITVYMPQVKKTIYRKRNKTLKNQKLQIKLSQLLLETNLLNNTERERESKFTYAGK